MNRSESGTSREAFRRDAERALGTRNAGVARIARALLADPGFLAVGFYRLQASLAPRKPALARVCFLLNRWLTGAEFVVGCRIGPGLVVRHAGGIVIGTGARIGDDCTLLQGVTVGERRADGHGGHAYPRIGDGVVIGANSCVLGPVVVGDSASIGAMTLVLADVPPGAVAVGVPARITAVREC